MTKSQVFTLILRFSGKFALIGCLLLSSCTHDSTMLSPEMKNIGVKSKPLSAGIGNTSSAKELAQKGLSFLKEGEYEKASDALNHAIRLTPQNSYLHYLNALTYQLWGAENPSVLPNAEVGYKVALNFDAGNALAALTLGQFYMNENQYTKAQNQFANALLSSPYDQKALMGLATASYMSQDIQTALNAVHALEKAKSTDAQFYRIATLIYAAADEPATAQTYFLKFKASSKDVTVNNYIESRLSVWQDFYSTVEKNDLSALGEEVASERAQSIAKTLASVTPQSSSTPRSSTVGSSTNPFGTGSPSLNDGKSSDFARSSPSSSSSYSPSSSSSPPSSYQSSYSPSYSSSNSNEPLRYSDSPSGTPFGFMSMFGSSSSSYSSSASSGSSSSSGYSSSSSGTSPASHKMIALDVMIVRTAHTSKKQYGNNLLSAIGNISGNFTTTYRNGVNNVNTSSKDTSKIMISSSLGLSNINYSLNIANDMTSHSEILSNPTLIAMDGTESTFSSGNQVYFETSSASFAPGSITPQTIGTSLTVKPTFMEDGKIILAVSANQATFYDDVLSSILQAAISKVRFQTSVSGVKATSILAPGESLVLSGITEKQYGRVYSGTPGLGELPITSFFFGEDQSETATESLLYIITPRFFETVVTDAAGNMISVPSEDMKKEEAKKFKNFLIQSYPSIFGKDMEKTFLSGLEIDRFSRHFRPTDMPPPVTMDAETVQGIIQEVSQFFK